MRNLTDNVLFASIKHDSVLGLQRLLSLVSEAKAHIITLRICVIASNKTNNSFK